MEAVSDSAPWWLAGGTAAIWLVRETWGALLSRKKDRTETDANIDLLNGLVARVKALEETQAKVTEQLDKEIALRRSAEEEAHRLRMRVQLLESTLRGMGAVIPPEAPIV